MEKLELTPKNITVLAFIAVEAVIYLIFNILWFTVPNDPIYLKYAGILLCLAVTGVFIYFHRDRDSIVLCAALFFTAVSDLFILVLDDYYEIGLVTFIITQSIYVYRLYADRLNKIWITLTVRAVVSVTLIIIMYFVTEINFLIVEVGFYIVMLVGNVVDAMLLCRKGRENLLFAIGLLLFLGCDICVGLRQGSRVGMDLDEATLNTVQFFIWFFYLPAQVLITLSASRGGINKFVKEKSAENASITPSASQVTADAEKTEADE